MTTIINDISELQKLFDDNASRLDFSTSFESVSDMLAETHSGYFNDQADPNAIPWKPLSPATVKKKGHPIILIETNKMRSSVVNRKHANHVERTTKSGLDWGTNEEKAEWHQEGTDRVPQRQFIGWNESAIQSAAETMADVTVDLLLGDIGTP